MSRFLPGALVAAFVFCLGLAAPAAAALLSVKTDPSLGFSLSGAVEISDDAGGLIVNNAAGARFAAFGVVGLTDDAFDVFVIGDSLDHPVPAAQLFIDGLDGSVTGDLAAFNASASMVELLFDVASDDFGVFGPRVLMLVTGDFAAGRFATDASATINALAPIPLPAGLPLLAVALAAMAAAARRRRA